MKALTSEDPRQLGNNRLLAVIGRGGMGRVLLGRTPTGRLVAVKQIHRHLAEDPEFHTRFEREVSASRQITGAYTAAVVDSDTESETPWLATEYIPGPDLGTVIQDCGPLHLGGLRLLAVGLASALFELHGARLVHRDLKPGNVLLTPEGPRVIDFGIARSLENETMTATGSVVGSPAYMSPEQAEGRELTPAADVFSVGAILAMAATGSSPFPGKSTPQILYSVIRATPDIDRVPPSLRDLVAACLAKDPEHRPTARQLLEATSRIPAESMWPQPVLDRISAHRADGEWWVETAAKQAKLQERLEGIRQRRRRALRRAAATAVSLLVVAGTGAAGYQSGQMSGRAEPLADPALALTAAELRLIDTCELLDTAVVEQIGFRSGDLKGSSNSCQTTITDDSGRRSQYALQVGAASRADRRISSTHTGEFVGWTPIVGDEDRLGLGTCTRSVVNRSGVPTEIRLEVNVFDEGTKGKAGVCLETQRALRAVVEQLLVYVPTRQRLPDSILRLDPCSVLDPELSREVAGDPAKRDTYPHRCDVDGSEAWFYVELAEGQRPDSSIIKSNVAVPLGEYTVYGKNESSTTCTLSYMVRPTTGELAEFVRVSVEKYSKSQDACEMTKKILVDVIPRLPKS